MLKDIVDVVGPKRSPVRAFDRVIERHEKRYEGLRKTALQLLYTKNKLENDLVERRAEVARVDYAARTAAKRGDDEKCLELLASKRRLVQRLERAESGVEIARHNAKTARRALDDFSNEIRELTRERTEHLGMLATVELEQRLTNTRFSERAKKDALLLENARQSVERMTAGASLDDYAATEALEDPFADEDLKIELARLKQRTRALREVAEG
ncbi:MAG: hypothetical protein RMA76_03825 [Deltaproteobacteria bacterium]